MPAVTAMSRRTLRWAGLAVAVTSRPAPACSRGVTAATARGDFRSSSSPRRDIPVGIAPSPDGAIWFTLEASDAIGVLRNGTIQKLPKGADSVEPLGLAVDAGGRAWYTEAPKQRISRVSTDGTIASFGLATPGGPAGPARDRSRR